MARRSSTLLLLAGGLAPSLAACAVAGAGAGPSPMRVAYADLPPPPAELFAATNGKADAPLQVDGRMAVALLAQRAAYDAAVARTPKAAAPAQVAVAAPTASAVHVAAASPQAAPGKAAVQLAKAPVLAAPVARPVQVAKAAPVVPRAAPSTAKPVLEVAAFAPAKPLPYAEFVRADIVLNTATPLVRPTATAPVKSSATAKRHIRVIATETKASAERVASAAPAASGTVVWLTPHRVTKQARADMPVMTRIDTMIRSWFARIRS